MHFIFLLMTAVLMTALPAQAGSLFGTATVIDGKFIDVAGTRLQLFGIDTPALKQTCKRSEQGLDKTIPCGKLAKWALMDLVIGAKVSCIWKNKSRQLATCTAGGFDVARNLVHTGWALADREQSDSYVVNENEAKAAKRGLWKGTFTPPKQWRELHEQRKNK